MEVKQLRLGLLILTVLAGSAQSIPAAQGETFRRPDRRVTADDRIVPHPAWISVKWDPKQDKVFAAVDEEYKHLRVFKGFDRSGVWSSKAKKAYEEWRIDCQNPVKLYRACRFFGVASELDPSFAKEKDTVKKSWDLNYGWDVLRNPPKSYLFVRAGYRMNAGDLERHIYGDLARRLLAKEPVDRGVAIAAAGELWDERPGRKDHRADKGPEFETFVIEALLKARTSPEWRPWDDVFISKTYLSRALRTSLLEDIDKAIFYNEEAIRKSPRDYGKAYLLQNRTSLTARRKMILDFRKRGG